MSITKLLVSAAFVSAIGFAMPATATVGAGGAGQISAASAAKQFILARRGADDGANHNKNDDRGRGRGRNDGANHTRNGADDGAGHDAGDDRGRGRGRG